MEKKDHVIIVLVGITIFLAGMVLFSPGDNSNSTPVPQSSAPSTQTQVQYRSLSSVPSPVVNSELEDYFPTDLKLNGLLGISAFPTSIHDDLGPDADHYLSSVVSSDAVLFINSDASTNTFVQYEVYKFKDAATAAELLNLYKSNWNVQNLVYSGLNIWAWNGFIQQGTSPYPASVPVYWDESTQKAFLPVSQQGEVIISQLGSSLYCNHGEMNVGEYFIMIDVHAPKSSIDQISREIWEEALADISDAPATVSSGVVPSGITPMSLK
ncbi:MAG: hypothetical protein P1P69_03325 [Methanosarcinaceae archaeon]|nr:hypothetical protein [Methanosarcinaceae archaeon]MDF1533517.1 hypothetical protein [Methanosarcinaceae archaeon]